MAHKAAQCLSTSKVNKGYLKLPEPLRHHSKFHGLYGLRLGVGQLRYVLLIDYQQNRQPEIIRLAVALIMCAVLLPVFGCPLGGSGGYGDGKGVQIVAGQPVGEAVFD